MTRTDLYQAATPFGLIAFDFGEEGGCTVTGPQDAIDHFEHVISQCTNAVGASISLGNLEPSTLAHFCQPKDGLITIIPPVASDQNGK